MTHPPILLFDFDGVVITQKALEFTALMYLKKEFYNWRTFFLCLSNCDIYHLYLLCK